MTERDMLENRFVHAVILAQMPTPIELWHMQQKLDLRALPNLTVAILVDVHEGRTRFVGDRQKFTLREQLTKVIRCAWPCVLTMWHEDLECIILLVKEDGHEMSKQLIIGEVYGVLENLDLPFGATIHAGISEVVEGPMLLPSGVRGARCAARYAKQTGQLLCHEADFDLDESYVGEETKSGSKGEVEVMSPNRSQMIQKAVEYITTHLHEELELEKIAANCLVSHYYLSHLFRKETGTTVTAFIKKSRIDKAMELLKLQEYSVADVAYRVGYQDPNYFSKSFRTYVGVTPTEFRRKIL